MTKRVLSIGQCSMDHGNISRMIENNFDASVVGVSSKSEAEHVLDSCDVSVVLVNRLLDADGSSGLDVIQELQAGPHRDTPILMVSNFEDAQQSAGAAGARRGFGKANHNTAATKACLGEFLPGRP